MPSSAQGISYNKQGIQAASCSRCMPIMGSFAPDQRIPNKLNPANTKPARIKDGKTMRFVSIYDRLLIKTMSAAIFYL
jgi:hypothetical protein